MLRTPIVEESRRANVHAAHSSSTSYDIVIACMTAGPVKHWGRPYGTPTDDMQYGPPRAVRSAPLSVVRYEADAAATATRATAPPGPRGHRNRPGGARLFQRLP
jgi:hypothetical protein